MGWPNTPFGQEASPLPLPCEIQGWVSSESYHALPRATNARLEDARKAIAAAVEKGEIEPMEKAHNQQNRCLDDLMILDGYSPVGSCSLLFKSM